MTTLAATEFRNQPFSFSEILAPTKEKDTASPIKLLGSDGVELSITIYEPPTPSDVPISLLFYHGGGAYSGGGYQFLATGLAEHYGITVYLPDIRGHGASGGARGDAPSKQQVWRDIDTALDFVVKRQEGGKIYLGGHSSGGGLIVNYATEKNNPRTKLVDGYVFVSPELGYLSGTDRAERQDFAKVNVFAFIANGIFGVLGHNKAVQFAYPTELLERDKNLVGFNTVNMANAITPDDPKGQLKLITEVFAKPVGLWVGADDELFVAGKVADFVPQVGKNISKVLPGKNHLGILVHIHEHIGPWITGHGTKLSNENV